MARKSIRVKKAGAAAASFSHGDLVTFAPSQFGLASFGDDPYVHIYDTTDNQPAYDGLADLSPTPVGASYPWARVFNDAPLLEKTGGEPRHAFDSARYRRPPVTRGGFEYLTGFVGGGNPRNGIYVRYWIRIDPGSYLGGSTKIIRIWGRDNGNERYLSWTNTQASPNFGGCNSGGAGWSGLVNPGNWDNLEILIRRPDLADRSTWYQDKFFNGVLRDRKFWQNDCDYPINLIWDTCNSPVVYYMGLNPRTDYPLYADEHIGYRMTDIYIASEPQRFEITDSATYSISSVREIQEPVDWQSSAVQVRIRQNAHASLPGKYVHFIGADNEPAGTPLAIS